MYKYRDSYRIVGSEFINMINTKHTITNDDIAPKLKLVKEVTNDNGGDAVADENVSNVSLWGSWNGAWHLNETNSSGLNGEYIFTKNLGNDGDGNYTWMIRVEEQKERIDDPK